MTAKREAELETEVRMLREQVASLERIIAGMHPLRLEHYVAPGCAGYPLQYWYPWTFTVSNGGNQVIGGSTTLTGDFPEGSTVSLS
jgi:hypothetical protein